MGSKVVNFLKLPFYSFVKSDRYPVVKGYLSDLVCWNFFRKKVPFSGEHAYFFSALING